MTNNLTDKYLFSFHKGSGQKYGKTRDSVSELLTKGRTHRTATTLPDYEFLNNQ